MAERDNVLDNLLKAFFLSRASFVSIQLIPGLVCVSRKHWHKAMRDFKPLSVTQIGLVS